MAFPDQFKINTYFFKNSFSMIIDALRNFWCYIVSLEETSGFAMEEVNFHARLRRMRPPWNISNNIKVGSFWSWFTADRIRVAETFLTFGMKKVDHKPMNQYQSQTRLQPNLFKISLPRICLTFHSQVFINLMYM